MKHLGAILCLPLLACALPTDAQDASPAKPTMVIAAGAAGDDTYAPQFTLWAQQWQNTATQGGFATEIVGQEKATAPDKAELQRVLAAQPAAAVEPLWIVLIGHGTWDGKQAKFNLRGDDVDASELNEWLRRFERPLVIVATFSASGPWLTQLTGPGRIVVTATRSGSEENFSRLGEYLPGSFTDTASDLDKDGQVSLLEAWLSAAKATADFYANEGRLATEHSLLEDNGDGKGTPPDWFQGVRAVKKAKDNATPDGLRAHQLHLLPNPAERAIPAPIRQERDAIELEIAKLRETKSTMEEGLYYAKLESLLLKLAKLYAD
jgi:hypothetical protein